MKMKETITISNYIPKWHKVSLAHTAHAHSTHTRSETVSISIQYTPKHTSDETTVAG